MHALLVKGPDELEGCIEGSPEEAEFASIADALEAGNCGGHSGKCQAAGLSFAFVICTRSIAGATSVPRR